MLLTSGVEFAVKKLFFPTTANTQMKVIGVGDGQTSATRDQKDLQGSNKAYKQCDSGFPKQQDNKLTYQVTFKGNEANFAWNEWGVFDVSSGTKEMLNRVQTAMSRKLQGQVWIFEAVITINKGGTK
ncbi:MAG: hypothetical protein ACRCX2_30240 [Paraclostridium sp.]